MDVGRIQAMLAFDMPARAVQPESAAGSSFGEILRDAVGKVEQDQVAVTEATQRLATGQVQDVAEVMILSERANLSLGLALQVRNKVLEAYQEIMRMPL